MTKKFIPIQCKICENYEPEEVICGIEPKLTLTKEACESLNIFSHYLVDYLKELEQHIKGIEQQLADLLNMGPTITQKKIWLDELVQLEMELMQKHLEPKLKKLLNTDNIEFLWKASVGAESVKDFASRLRKLK